MSARYHLPDLLKAGFAADPSADDGRHKRAGCATCAKLRADRTARRRQSQRPRSEEEAVADDGGS